MIEIAGVVTKPLPRHHDPRGYFQENIRVTDDFFSEGFGQWSESEMYQGVIKAWHIHQEQVDWWYCSEGVIKAVLCDLRHIELDKWLWNKDNLNPEHWDSLTFAEYILGIPDDPFILKIPPGVAHGCKVLQGPAKLSYITSKVYNPDDEGRILYDALGYDWHEMEIK